MPAAPVAPARAASRAVLLRDSLEAQAVVRELRQRFRIELPDEPDPFRSPPVAAAARRPARTRAVLGEPAADRFEQEGAWIRPRVPAAALRRVIHPARVTLPSSASRPFVLRDEDTGMWISVSLAGARDVEAEAADGYLVYRGAAPGGGHIVHRVHAEGTEDYVTFETPPARGEVGYELALGDNVAGLRLVGNVLELLDAGSAPRLRMGAPYLVDANGQGWRSSVGIT